MSSSGFAQFVPLILIFVIFYFFLIRPQQKKIKDHKLMVSALKRGDDVITSGGIVARVEKVHDDDKIDLLISDYSSIITDFLLLKRPIIFHIPDYEYYNNYGLNVDFKSFLPGKEILNLIDLQNLIIDKTVFTISKKNESDIYLKMFYDTEIKKSCQRYLQYFNNSLCVE